jgi:collagenase-like PrtC family protease
VFAFVDDLQKVKYWENLGADSITLNSILINRDFDTLKKIRETSKSEFTIMVNQCCIQSCNLSSPYHALTISHASQEKHPSDGFMIDYCYLRCSLMRMLDPVNFIRADWIRPEDIHVYENLGYDRFKIIERTAPTKVLVERVKAYANRRYDGNFYDIIRQFIFDGKESGIKNKLRLLKIFLRPGKINPLKLMKVKRIIEKQHMFTSKLGSPPIYIDNRKLDGFLEKHPKSCRNRDCDECRYCHEIAERAIYIKKDYKKELISLYENLLKELKTGTMWKW